MIDQTNLLEDSEVNAVKTVSVNVSETNAHSNQNGEATDILQKTLKNDGPFSRYLWLTNSQMEELAEAFPYAWQTVAYIEFVDIVGKKNFPCLFAKRALKNADQHFVFLNNLESEELDRLSCIIPIYVKKIRIARENNNYIQPLMVMVFPDPQATLLEHRQQAWSILQYLHDRDPQPWPDNIPKDPTHKDWSFCHSGEQLFTNISSPKHREQHSRNLGSCLTLAINPRENFDKVAPKGEGGYRIRERIQERARIYDGREEATPVAFYGDEDHLEWSMYALPEKETPLTKTCPFKHKKS